jgi:hypothetical protein
MSTASSLRRVGPAGGSAGVAFTDQCPVRVINIQAGWWIDGILVSCQDGRSLPRHGGTGGGAFSFPLQPGERIVAISGFTRGNSGDRVYGLQIHTNQRSSQMYGNGGDERGQVPFRLDVPEGFELAGFFGNGGQALESIGLLVRPGATGLRSVNYPDRHLGTANGLAMLMPGALEAFRVVPGLAGVGVSLESVAQPGHYLRHQNSRLILSAWDGSDLFRADATFHARPGLANPRATSLESSNFPGHFLRHRNSEFWMDALDPGPLFAADATFELVTP